jgi:hypothetical protein
MVLLVLQVHVAQLELMASRVQQAQLDPLELMASRVQQDPQDLKVPQELTA